MEAGSQGRGHCHEHSGAAAATISDDVRSLVAAATSDICASLSAPFCAVSRVRADDAVIISAQGPASAAVPTTGARWRISDVPPARQAVITKRAVLVSGSDDPRLTDRQREALTGNDRLTHVAFVPLLGRDATVGLLVVAERRPRDLAVIVDRLGTLPRLMAVVLDQDDRLERLGRSADDLALVLDADIEAQTPRSGPDQALRVVARRLAELCDAPMAEIHAVDGDYLRTRVSWSHGGFRREHEDSLAALAERPLAQAAVLSGRTEIVTSPDDPRLSEEQRADLDRRHAKSLLAIALLGRGGVIGVAEVLDVVPRDFDRESRPARALAEIAAHLLDKARLLAALEQRERSLHEIVALGARVNETREPVELAAFVSRRLLDVTGATCCEIYKIERGELRCLVSLDVRPGFDDPDASAAVELDEFPSLGRAARQHELLVFATVDDPRLTLYERQMLERWGFSSELSIPLLIDERLVGMIDIFDTRARDYAEHLDFARSVGQLVAGSFDSLLLLERLAESNRELRLLADSSLDFGASLDLDEVLHSVASRMCLAAESDCCDIYAIEGDLLRGLVSADGDSIDEGFPGTTYALKDLAIARRAIDIGQPVAVTEVAGDPRLTATERAENERFGFRALIELPLIDRGEVVGVASIFDRDAREFRHLDLLRGLGQIAAQAIANARVYAAVDAGSARLRQINDASLELASSLDRQTALDSTARRLCSVARADCCDIYTLQGRTLRCESSIVAGRVDEDRLRHSFTIDDWRALRLAVESRTVVTVSGPDDRRLSDQERRGMARHDQRSGLIVPLIVEDRVIGATEVFQTGRRRVFTEDEVATIEAVCRVAALAIVNAGLFRDAELRSRESELLNQIAVKVGASLESGQIAGATIEELAGLVPFTEASLLIADDDGTWKPVYGSSAALSLRDPESLAGLSHALLDRLQSEDVLRIDPEDLPRPPATVLGSPDVRSLLVIGIRIDDAIAGALILAAPGGDAFADVDRHLLTRVSALLALSFKNARLYGTIKTMHVSNLKALISALNARDHYAVGHAARVAGYTVLLGRELGWPADRLQQITEAAFLHDVGRIGISDDVLYKPGRLSAEETADLRRHPVASAEILKPLFAADIVRAVRHHHERWDGRGYPDGLAGTDIPEVARALCIVDSYDAMSFQRPHREALSYTECLAELKRCRGEQFDPTLVTAFMRVLDRLDERRSIARQAAETAATRIDPPALVAFEPGGDESLPQHVRMSDALREVRDAFPGVRFLTTIVPSQDGWRMACDPEENPDLQVHLGDHLDRSSVGDGSPVEQADRNVLQLDDLGLWVTATGPVYDEDGDTVGLVCADVTPADDWPAELGVGAPSHDRTLSAIIESATARLGRDRVDAVTDGLTGLYNQRYFKQRLGEEVARATEQDRPLSLLFCDLDRFKRYNDRLGHVAGDRALHAVAGVVLRSIRQVDLAARYGGEELTVILIDTAGDAAIDVAERIRTGVAALDLGGPAQGLTVSIGCAAFPDDARSVEELIDKSDWAMYLAKRRGRNRVTPFRSAATEEERETRASQPTNESPQAGPPS